MIPYLIAFAASTPFVALAPRVSDRYLRVLCYIAALVPVSLLAAFRDPLVGGPDRTIYGDRLFVFATESRYLRHYIAGQRYEVGYLVLNWIVSRATSSFVAYYFLLSMLICGIVLVACALVHDYADPWLSWLAFLCTSYWMTFNIMRQSIALALVALSFSLVCVKRPKAALITSALAMLFHQTAIVAFILWGVASFLLSGRRGSLRRIALFTVAAVPILIFSDQLLYWSAEMIGGGRYVHALRAGTIAPLTMDAYYRLLPIALGVLAIVHSLKVFRANRADLQISGFRDPANESDGHGAPDMSSFLATFDNKLLIACVMFLVIDIALLPLRNIGYFVDRIAIYISWLRFVSYAVVAKSLSSSWRFAPSLFTIFLLIVFILGFAARPFVRYTSVILNLI